MNFENLAQFALTRAEMKVITGGGSFYCHYSGYYYVKVNGKKVRQDVSHNFDCALASSTICESQALGLCKKANLSGCSSEPCTWIP